MIQNEKIMKRSKAIVLEVTYKENFMTIQLSVYSAIQVETFAEEISYRGKITIYYKTEKSEIVILLPASISIVSQVLKILELFETQVSFYVNDYNLSISFITNGIFIGQRMSNNIFEENRIVCVNIC